METWMGLFVLLTPFVTSGILCQTIELENRVFLALAGEDLNIQFKVVQPVNQSGTGECFNPMDNLIHKFEPSRPTATVNVKLTNVTSANTGEFHCKYKRATVYWTVLVRDEGYREPPSRWGYRGVVIVGAVTLVLLIFCVAGSVYVFCWHNEPLEDESANTSGIRVQRTEQRTEESKEEEDMSAASDSFYTSLEARPVSIYEVLNTSATSGDTGQAKALPRSNISRQPAKVEQITYNKNDGEFESIYENS